MSNETVPKKEEEKEENSNNPVKEAVKKVVSTKMKGNVDKTYELEKAEKEYVHFWKTDHSAPVPTDPIKRQEHKMPRILCRMHPESFVQLFKMNFENNMVRGSINTADKLFRILRNLTPEIVNTQWEDQIASASTGKPSTRREVRARILNQKKLLRLNGGLITVGANDILHVPGVDKNNIDKFPQECLFDIYEDDI